MAKTDPLEKAEKKLEQAKAQVQALKVRGRERDRKDETRRKIVIGAAVITMAGKGPEAEIRLRNIIAALPERDRKLFENWKP